MPGLWSDTPGFWGGIAGLWSGGKGLSGIGANPDAIALANAVITDVQATANAFTKVTVNVNGLLQAQEAAATRTIMPWIGNPANASQYLARMTTISGLYDPASSPRGVFVPCSGSPAWSTLQTSVGTATTVGLLEIRKIGAPQILASCTITQIGTKNALATGFDTGFNPSPFLVYSEQSRLVVRTNDIARLAIRGLTGHTSGKRYVELLVLVERLRFGGIVDSTFSVIGAGGPAGVNRVGVEANRLVYDGGNDVIGAAQPGSVVRVAWNGTAKLLWLKIGAGEWNDNPLADPAIGNGGVSTAGLVGPAYVGVTLRPVTGAGVRYRLPGDAGYAMPPGYTEWSE